MKSVKKAPKPMSSLLARLDDSPMRERDREIAKAYMRKTDAMLDLIWFVGATIRAATTAALSRRSGIGTRLSGQKRIQAHLQ